MEGNGRQDRHFPGCIQAFNICGRISLRITKLRGKCQSFLKFHSFLCHFRQDKVGGSVDNSHHLRDLISGQTLLQRTDDRNSACYRSFKEKVSFCFCCGIHQFFSVRCQKIFIGCHHTFSGMQGIQDIASGRLNAAHDLHNNRNLWILQNTLPFCGKDRRIIQLFCRFFCVPYKNFFQLDFRTYLMGNFFFLCFQYFIDTGTHRSKSQQCDLNIFHFSCLLPGKPNSFLFLLFIPKNVSLYSL